MIAKNVNGNNLLPHNMTFCHREPVPSSAAVVIYLPKHNIYIIVSSELYVYIYVYIYIHIYNCTCKNEYYLNLWLMSSNGQYDFVQYIYIYIGACVFQLEMHDKIVIDCTPIVTIVLCIMLPNSSSVKLCLYVSMYVLVLVFNFNIVIQAWDSNWSRPEADTQVNKVCIILACC